MGKPLPTNKAAFRLVARRIAENKEGFNQSQLCNMLQALDRWAEILGLYHAPLTPPNPPYTRNPLGISSKVGEKEEAPYAPKMTLEEAFGQIGGDNAANQSSQ